MPPSDQTLHEGVNKFGDSYCQVVNNLKIFERDLQSRPNSEKFYDNLKT